VGQTVGLPHKIQIQPSMEQHMKVKTNIRAGKQSGTVASGGGSNSTNSVEPTSAAPVVVVYNFVLNSTRCVGV
jgi:hypothetical protein